MTNEDAIYTLKNLAVLSTEKDMPQIEEALNMAIEALADHKTEPQKCKTEKCAWWSIGKKYCALMLRDMPCEYKPRYEDEPQTDCSWK